MKELIFQDIEKNQSAEQKTNILRENLQVIILKELSDRGMFKNISFVGGTALRIVHGLNRFSEDLDFSLTLKKGFDFDAMCQGLYNSLNKSGIEYNKKTGGQAVKFLFLKFPGLIAQAGAGSMKSQNISVKIEVDMNPPGGWRNETVLINKFYIFQLNCHDLPSLFSGKLHACLFRKYSKARDYYDLLWYLTKKVTPNYKMLSNAARQTENKEAVYDSANLPAALLKRLEKVDFKQVKSDVEKFLINRNEAQMLTLPVFKQLIKNKSWSGE
ncbi:MAG: hypothetical protein CVV21_11345 [Candidatus Goldiibacteriota bacterium HGW-Goldbacteria-1]|jgi:predicted nucleotidyltransferase component of viral defense system|nr:MAG: hypothetical protein CVV21_11345 [Candidatus Goldiibacteriota bacterium HGW-Goldbacteria-1]